MPTLRIAQETVRERRGSDDRGCHHCVRRGADRLGHLHEKRLVVEVGVVLHSEEGPVEHGGGDVGQHLDGGWLDPRLAIVRVRESGADGAILVRPDRVVAWRAMGGAESPDTEIGAALDQVLARRS